MPIIASKLKKKLCKLWREPGTLQIEIKDIYHLMKLDVLTFDHIYRCLKIRIMKINLSSSLKKELTDFYETLAVFAIKTIRWNTQKTALNRITVFTSLRTATNEVMYVTCRPTVGLYHLIS